MHSDHAFRLINEYAAIIKKELNEKKFWDRSDELVCRIAKIKSRIELNQSCHKEAVEAIENCRKLQKLKIDNQFVQYRNNADDFYSKKDEGLWEESKALSKLLEALETHDESNFHQLIDTWHTFQQLEVEDNFSRDGFANMNMSIFGLDRLLLKSSDVQVYDYSIGLPFSISFCWDEIQARYNIFLNAFDSSSSKSFLGVGLYLIETDIGGKTRRYDCHLADTAPVDNCFLIAQIPENYFRQLAVCMSDNDVLLAKYDDTKEEGDNIWSERHVVQELFLANDLPKPEYDETGKRYMSDYSTEWSYQEEKLKSM
jgi:hypothetical protein